MQRAHKSPRLLFAGGGTGGHAYPAIAIAKAVARLAPSAEILFAGTRDRIEWKAVPQAGFDIVPVTVTGIQRRLSWRNVVWPFKLVAGFLQSLRIVKKFDPDIAVGTGGFVAGPVLLAASVLRRPIVLQEQNAFAGKTNRWLSKRATQIHVAFPEAMAYFPKGRSILSGNPTRPELATADPVSARTHFDIPESVPVLFVFGGSLGSAALNQVMASRLEDILSDIPNLHVIWQTGALYFDRYQASVADRPRLRLLKYVERMDLAYAAADIVLCRSGASTCSELAVTGSTAILVPSPNVAEDHQRMNAMSLVKADAAVMVEEGTLERDIVATVSNLLADLPRRRDLSANIARLAKPDAAEDIARHVLEHVGWTASSVDDAQRGGVANE